MQKPTSDMLTLARAVLEGGDVTAALALADCVAESANGGERITRQYVEQLEDTLHHFKNSIIANTKAFPIPERFVRDGDVEIPAAEAKILYQDYWKCQQVAKSLNRSGLD